MATKKTETKKAEETKTVKAAAPKAAKPAAKAAAKPAVKKTAEKKPAVKPAAKKAAPKAAPKAAKKGVEVIIQSPMGGNITPEAILAKVGKADKVYIRVDENKAYWVHGKETGSVDLWD